MHKNCLTYPVEFAADAFGESEALAQMLLCGREGADEAGQEHSHYQNGCQGLFHGFFLLRFPQFF